MEIVSGVTINVLEYTTKGGNSVMCYFMNF